MSDKTYKLVFQGEFLEDCDRHKAISELIKTCDLTKKRVLHILRNGNSVVLCIGLKAGQVFDFQEQFSHIGIKTHIKEQD